MKTHRGFLMVWALAGITVILILAGSVARSCTDRFAIFEDAFLSDPLMRQITQAVPIGVIRDDMAALHGCLAAIR